ncbi:MAG: tetratricopeptide repeat protein [Myxococcales bacterium]|nr:tetratricopeptide repeat protein [Myxococcales bacterium]
MDSTSETPSDFVFEVTTASFQKEVIDRSFNVPVVVDFWAEWCSPCRVLGPVLERVVQAFSGRVLLAKVNTDQEGALAQHFRISGIPAVKVFHRGRVVNEFVGVRDQRFIATFLDAIVPSPAAEAMEQAAQALMLGDAQKTVELVTPLLSMTERPLSVELRDRALLLLAYAELRLGHEHAVPPLLSQLDPRSSESERADVLRQTLEFLQQGTSLLSESDAEARLADEAGKSRDELADAHFAQAAYQARSGLWEPALQNLLWLIENHRRYRDDAGRKALIVLFQYIGHVIGDHPAVHEARRRLQVLL